MMENQKKSFLKWAIGSAIGLGVLGLGFTAFAYEDPREMVKACMSSVQNQCEQWAFAGGGSGNPRGLTTEVAVELAMGERYMMYGTVSIYKNQAFLEIDFKEHPWLKNRRRATNPYYRIDTTDLEKWKKLNRKYVSFAATAGGALFVNEEGQKSFDIVLIPTSEPTLDSLRK